MELENIEFGVEVEFTSLSKEEALECIQRALGGGLIYGNRPNSHVYYEGRKWSVISDSSIRPEISSKSIKERLSQRRYTVSEIKSLLVELSVSITPHRFELVTPVCTVKDIPSIQAIIREFRRVGVLVNDTTGIHLHIGLQSVPIKTALSFIGMIGRYQQDIYDLFNVEQDRKEEYCVPVRNSTINIAKVNYKNYISRENQNLITTSEHEEHIKMAICNSQIMKYYLLNTTSIPRLNTMEFRGFNSTLHSGKLKAYIYFILTLLMRADNCNGFHNGVKPKNLKTIDDLRYLYNKAYNYKLSTIRYKQVQDSFIHFEKRFETSNYFRKY